MSTEKYLIESIEHTHGDVVIWWRPNSLGYTDNIDEAGRYTKAEADSICELANRGAGTDLREIAWTETDVLAGAVGNVRRIVEKA